MPRLVRGILISDKKIIINSLDFCELYQRLLILAGVFRPIHSNAEQVFELVLLFLFRVLLSFQPISHPAFCTLSVPPKLKFKKIVCFIKKNHIHKTI